MTASRTPFGSGFEHSVDANERGGSGVKLRWVTKPERSCRDVTLMTAAAFVTTVFVRSVDGRIEMWRGGLGLSARRPRASVVGPHVSRQSFPLRSP
jgi:hypothetical protein